MDEKLALIKQKLQGPQQLSATQAAIIRCNATLATCQQVTEQMSACQDVYEQVNSAALEVRSKTEYCEEMKDRIEAKYEQKIAEAKQWQAQQIANRA